MDVIDTVTRLFGIVAAVWLALRNVDWACRTLASVGWQQFKVILREKRSIEQWVIRIGTLAIATVAIIAGLDLADTSPFRQIVFLMLSGVLGWRVVYFSKNKRRGAGGIVVGVFVAVFAAFLLNKGWHL